MIEFLIAALALGFGLVAGILWARRHAAKQAEEQRLELEAARSSVKESEVRWEEREKAHQQQVNALQAARKELEDAFGNLSKAALRENRQDFLAQAEEKLKPLNDHALDIAQLQRQVDILEDKYRIHSEKLEQARVDEALEVERISNVNVVQPATFVEKPVSPRKLLTLMVGLVKMISLLSQKSLLILVREEMKKISRL